MIIKVKNNLKRFKYLVSLYRFFFQKKNSVNNYEEIVKVQNNSLSNLPKFSNKISFSIVVSICKPDLSLLKKMIASVTEQIYSNWQLILVDDNSENIKLTKFLSNLSDPRIIVIERKTKYHFSAALNSGLKVATGGFVLFLDQYDLLHSEALKTVTYFIEQNLDADVFYSDEDKIDAKGNRHTPLFKPSFNLDLLYSHNYISRSVVYRRTLLKKIGGFKRGYKGSQDYDLLLRAIEICAYRKVVHIPYVLYHKRQLINSVTELESSVQNAKLQALQQHLANKKVKVRLGQLANTHRIRWSLPKILPLVSIIIPTRNAKKLVQQCVDSIYLHTNYANFEILLINNQSDCTESIEYFSKLGKLGKVHLLDFNADFNYSAINNFAVKKANGEIILLLNNDVEVINSNWLSELVSHALRPEIGCVGAKLYYPNDTIQHAGVIIGLWGCAGHSHKLYAKNDNGYMNRLKVVQNYSAVTAACLAVRKDVYWQVGGFNETDLTVAFNDVDFCLKVQQAGFRNLWTPYAELYHHESISRGVDDTPEKIARVQKEISYMRKTWNLDKIVDPAYSQWLTQNREDFGY